SQVLDWVLRHHATLPEQPIGLTGSRPHLETLLREPPPETGQPFEQVLAEFQEKVAAYAFRVNHPRFLAFVPGAPSFLSVLGDWLCSGTNFFAGVWLEAAGPAEVEVVVLDWFKEFLGYPTSARGLLTSGGSEANLIALALGRGSRSRPAPLGGCRQCRGDQHRHRRSPGRPGEGLYRVGPVAARRCGLRLADRAHAGGGADTRRIGAGRFGHARPAQVVRAGL